MQVRVFKKVNNTWKAMSSSGLPTEKIYTAGLSFDHNNLPYIYYNGTQGNVMKLHAGKWEKVGSPFSKGEALSIRMGFDRENKPWVAYGDSENLIRSTVKKYVQGKWKSVGSGLPSTAEPIYLSHDFASPMLFTKKANFGTDPIQTYRLVNNQWSLVSKGENLISSVYTDVLVSDKGKCYIAYCDQQADYKATVKRLVNNRWDLVGDAGFSEGSCRSVSIGKDSDGSPMVLYFDTDDNAIVLKKWDGAAWSVQKPKFQCSNTMVSRSAITTSQAQYMLFLDSGKAELLFSNQ
jgi:hypothetical protein